MSAGFEEAVLYKAPENVDQLNPNVVARRFTSVLLYCVPFGVARESVLEMSAYAVASMFGSNLITSWHDCPFARSSPL